ncbi:Arc family DNA-binding protein [Paracidovorax avenae]|uniref:Arc family DNA-binding protein n=1 Tax=Paracidovorax avenae TaxID=80867 RepID=UPI0006B351C5|nr:Arc family DNA-binding protein [Paracidovorax avenae]
MEPKIQYPSDQADKVLVRMPDGMRDQLKSAAKANNRTLNAEIVSRLQDSFTRTHSSHLEAPGEQLKFSVVEDIPETRHMAVSLRDLVAAQAHQLQLLTSLIENDPRLGEALAHEIDPEKNPALAKELQEPEATSPRERLRRIADEVNAETFDRIRKANTPK